MTTSPLANIDRYLGYAGLALMLVLAITSAASDQLWGRPTVDYFISYSALILSFLSGSLWGKAIYRDQAKEPVKLAIWSNSFMLFAFIALLLGLQWPGLGILLLLAGYLGQWFIEYRTYRGISRFAWYRSLRWQLTAGAMVAHVLAMLG
ncbi:DUF3429 domain-containing protein [Suttonella sp. R2A3]|uniref:DUF3429 domain-containing protein n=1 Tax=Suttonella sp. R2A3 TaxID=2908648 RepID=UPI001F171CE4|nr:DUF3429 domain-containing protein [Suttonella sp. R2A3]UJF24596.1 DUF3429 domain-containing protein [Suttonella sp. R2A3]